MCLAIPAKILKIEDNTAKVENMGVTKEIDISLIPEAKVGDYVIVHAGFAIQIIDKEEALKTHGYWKEYLDAEKLK
ncbi:MAG: HypC/HybG/HupF family hydrogenase formation chaperone [Candidatus Humimicrobiaceae bacterium]